MLERQAGVPVDLRGDLFFDDSGTASFHCSFNTTLEQTCRVSGTKGTLTVDDFVLPCDKDNPVFTIERQEEFGDGPDSGMRSLKHEVKVPGSGVSQKTMLFRNFADLVLCGERRVPGWRLVGGLIYGRRERNRLRPGSRYIFGRWMVILWAVSETMEWPTGCWSFQIPKCGRS